MSVTFEGKEYNLEQAIDKGIGDLQQYLNDLQCYLRELAAFEVLDDDENEDFKQMTGYTDKADDAIDDMDVIFAELKAVTRQILGKCPKGAKAWYVAHKEERKRAAAVDKAARLKAKEDAKAFNAGKAALDAIAE